MEYGSYCEEPILFREGERSTEETKVMTPAELLMVNSRQDDFLS